MSGTKRPLLHMSLWRAQGQTYL